MIEPKRQLKTRLIHALFLAFLTLLNWQALGHNSDFDQPESASLTVSLDFARYQPSTDGAVNVTITKRNTANTPVKVLRNLEEFQGWLKRDDVLTVTLDGKALEYIGPQVKEQEAEEYDYVFLAPGDIVTSSFRIDDAFDFSAVGKYKIELLQRPGIEVDQNSFSASIHVDFARKQFKRTPSFLACGAAEQTAADQGLRVAEIYGIQSRNAMNSTAEDDREDSPRYKTWFGQYDPNRWSNVRSAYNKMASALSNQVITFNCACDANGIDPERVVAYVYSQQHYVINVCPLFFRYPTSGTNSKAGVIIHEMSHFNVIAGTKDHKYGQSNTRNLASSNPTQAINNADSFHYFSENPGNLPMVAGSNSGGGGDDGSTGGGTAGNGDSIAGPDQPQDPTTPEIEPKTYDFLLPVITLIMDENAQISDFDRAPFGTLDPALPADRSGKFNVVMSDDMSFSSAHDPKYGYSQANANYRTKIEDSRAIEVSWGGYGVEGTDISTDNNWVLRLANTDGGELKPGIYRNNIAGIYREHDLELRHGTQTLECPDGPTSAETRVHQIAFNRSSLSQLKMDFLVYCADDKTKLFSGAIEINEAAQDRFPDRSVVGKGDNLPVVDKLTTSGTSIKLIRDNIYLGTPEQVEVYGVERAKVVGRYAGENYFNLLISVPGDLIVFNMIANNWDTIEYQSQSDLVGYYDVLLGKLDPYNTRYVKSASGTFRVSRQGSYCEDSVSRLLVHKIDRHFRDAEFQFEQICQNSGERIRGVVSTNIVLPPPTYEGPIELTEDLPERMPTLSNAGGKLLVINGEVEQLYDSRTNFFSLTSGPKAHLNHRMQLEINSSRSTFGLLFNPASILSDGTQITRLQKGTYLSAGTINTWINNTIHILKPYRIDPDNNACGNNWLNALGDTKIYDVEYDSDGEITKLIATFEIYNCGSSGDKISYYLNYDLTLPLVEYPTPEDLTSSDIPQIAEFETQNTVLILEKEDQHHNQTKRTWSGLRDTNFDISSIEEGRGLEIAWIGNDTLSSIRFIRPRLLLDSNKNQPLSAGVYRTNSLIDGSSITNLCKRSGISTVDVKTTIFEIVHSDIADDKSLQKLTASFEFFCEDGTEKNTYHIRHDLTKPSNPLPIREIDLSPLDPFPNNSTENFLVYERESEGIVETVAQFIDDDVLVSVKNRASEGSPVVPEITFTQGNESQTLIMTAERLELLPITNGGMGVGVYEVLPLHLNYGPSAVLINDPTRNDCFHRYGGRLRIKSVENDGNGLPLKMTGDLVLRCGTDSGMIPFMKRASFGFDISATPQE